MAAEYTAKVIKHVADGRTYEIVQQWSGLGWQIIIRNHQGRRVGPMLSATFETSQEAEAYNCQPALDTLIEMAKEEIKSGRVKAASSVKA